MKLITLTPVFIIAVILVSGCTTTQTSTTENSAMADNAMSKPEYTMEEVAMHSTPDDCWMVIHDNVVNASNYFNHPGGEAVYEGCGIDATQLFETRPMGSGTPHSDEARGFMEAKTIGILKK